MDENPDAEIKFETFDYDSYIQTLQTALPAGNEADVLQMFGSWVCSATLSSNLSTVPDKTMSLVFGREELLRGSVGWLQV